MSRPRLLVVDPSPERRHHIAEKLRAAGCDPYEASTPLEAIDLIERPSSHITGVAVATNLTQTDGDELCEFVAETNPGIKLALIAEAVKNDTGRHRRISEQLPAVDASSDDTLDRSLKGWVDAVHTPPPRRDR
jgi:CheY-like chemotaxis protein